MAIIKVSSEDDRASARPIEEVEVRVWGLGGRTGQMFAIGSGANFNAADNIWLEITYKVNGLQVFYTRNFLHDSYNFTSDGKALERLECFERGENDAYGFGDMLPETGILVKRDRYTYTGDDGVDEVSISFELEISVDIGAVLGHSSPGDRMINIVVKYVDEKAAVQFMRDLIAELESAHQGKRPDPAEIPAASSDWSFARLTNRQTYDQTATTYQEDYFANPLLTAQFDAWKALLPPGGHILDAGCGHGHPVITRLLENGFRVSGTDLSQAMLNLARDKHPGVNFENRMISELTNEAEFDGACSLNSLLYLDPIDLYHSIYRLHQALKPGGSLFLFAYDSSPSARGTPLREQFSSWLWGWDYGIHEAAQALEEHGYFKVIQAANVTTEEEKEQMIDRWRKKELKYHEDFIKDYNPPGSTPPPAPDLTKVPDNMGYCYSILARREEK